MARKINRLSDRTVKAIKKPGRHADGGNLYLRVSPTGAKSWSLLFRWKGKLTEVGLGSFNSVPLADARVYATSARAQLARGVLPTGSRRSSGGSTFGEVADRVLEAMRPQWRSEIHARQWETTLREHAAPLLQLPVSQITTEDVLGVLKPLWGDRRETASRVRSRIEAVLDHAKAKGLRQGENPARWRGHLDHLLPRRQKLERKHHAAMPYAEVPAFMEKLRAIEGTAARALEFCILTAARTGEVLKATPGEFDLDATRWVLQAPRMKGGRRHEVPLSPRAVEIVRQMPEGDYVFPGRFPGTRMSDGMLDYLLKKRMNVAGATVHGFRSSFRDWAGDCTNHQRDVVESALAHAIENQTEAAYRRNTAIEKRRDLMKAWEAYCGMPPAANVIPWRKEVPA